MAMIKLTQYSNEIPIYINTQHIRAVSEDETGDAFVVFGEGDEHYTYVTESLEEIVELLTAATGVLSLTTDNPDGENSVGDVCN